MKEKIQILSFRALSTRCDVFFTKTRLCPPSWSFLLCTVSFNEVSAHCRPKDKLVKKQLSSEDWGDVEKTILVATAVAEFQNSRVYFSHCSNARHFLCKFYSYNFKRKKILPRDKSRIAYIVLATFHLCERKVCFLLQLILKIVLLKTALMVKPAVAIKKNVRARYWLDNSINWMTVSWSLTVT